MADFNHAVTVTNKYHARFGIFVVPKAEPRFDHNWGHVYGFLGVVNPDKNDECVFFVSKGVMRFRVFAVQCGMDEERVPSGDEIDNYTLTQPATMAPRWCPQVNLGEELWTKFVTQDPSAKADLSTLIDILRRVIKGWDSDRTVYKASVLLANPGTYQKYGVRL